MPRRCGPRRPTPGSPLRRSVRGGIRRGRSTVVSGPPVDRRRSCARGLEGRFVTGIGIRTRFYDDYVAAAWEAGCRQVVLLAAGLDTHAFRLHWPADLRLFEVDLPGLFAFKEAVLVQRSATPRCSRTVVVAIDLHEEWSTRLTAAGFDPAAPSAWTAEGLLPYLSNDDAAGLLERVGELSAPESRLSFDYDEFAEGSTLGKLRATPGMQEVASMWQGGLSESPLEWMRAHGWLVSAREPGRGRGVLWAPTGRCDGRIPRGGTPVTRGYSTCAGSLRLLWC